MVFKGKRKYVTAKHMADQIKGPRSAKTRIKRLEKMIEDEEKDIKTAQITIMKHLKEIRLLKEKFSLDDDNKIPNLIPMEKKN